MAIVVEMGNKGILEPVKHFAATNIVKIVTAASVDALLDIFSDARPQPRCDEVEMIELFANRPGWERGISAAMVRKLLLGADQQAS
jgi:hypothetical protein